MNVALVGLGYWGPNLLRVLNKLGVIYSAHDLDIAKVNKFASDPSYRHVRFSSDMLDYIEDIDAVFIATPPKTHFEIAKVFLQAGKHVFIEKPITTEVWQAEELITLAENKNRVLMVGHVFLYVAEVLKLKEIIDSGEIGDLLYIHASRLNLGQFQKSNVISDLAPHDISIFNFLVDSSVTRVFANGYGFINKNVVEVAKITFEYESSVVCDLHLSWLDPRKKRTTTVVGSKKMVVYDMMSDEKIKVYDKGVDIVDTASHDAYLLAYRHGDIYSPQTEIYEPLEKECRHFIDCVSNCGQPITSGTSGLSVVSILNGALRSLNTGEWVCI
jgi:predicted dehydrogenase